MDKMDGADGAAERVPGGAPLTSSRPEWRLVSIYARVFIWYVLAVILLWVVGIEGIYGSPMPFYALFAPAFTSIAVPAGAALAATLGYVFLSAFFVRRTRRATLLLHVTTGLLALFLLALLYAESMKRNEPMAWSLARHWAELRWHLLALGVLCLGATALLVALRKLNWFRAEPSRRVVGWFLVALVTFAFVFAATIAMLRGGPHGIAQAYERQTYEYIGDIGKTRDIAALFRDYLNVRPHLSMHAKVHPPGPIALLWLLSYAVGQDPLPLSVATMAFGVLALLPLYGWCAQLAGRRAALTCCLLYSLIPGMVLFTATSADILFMPFTLGTLFFFTRALERGSWASALAGGVGYAGMSILSFSLVGIGAYFAVAGLLNLARGKWRETVMTAFLMLTAFLAVHAALRWTTGFDIIACFHECKAQFDTDQAGLDLLSPRYASWVWKLANPACWFYYAGIPVSVLFLWRIVRPESETKRLFLGFAATLLVLNLLYLARGEGERSAMYVFPFMAVPAAHLLDRLGRDAGSAAPLVASLAFLGFQCWFTESYFYTFW